MSSRTDIALQASGATDAGAVRRLNQDRIFVRLGPEGGDVRQQHALLAVADGVGGAPSGEVASTIAIGTAAEEFDRLPAADPRALLSELFALANQRICDGGRRDPRSRGMACTLVAAVVQSGALWLASVGDSRGYLCHDSSLAQLTTDHTLAADDALEPTLKQLAARSRGARHILTRSLGSPSGVSPDTLGAIRLAADDRLLLCTDGLYNLVARDELQEMLRTVGGGKTSAADRLVQLAKERGAPDNVSAAILSVVACPRHRTRRGE